MKFQVLIETDLSEENKMTIVTVKDLASLLELKVTALPSPVNLGWTIHKAMENLNKMAKYKERNR